MYKQSLEKSLLFLAPSLSSNKKIVSPVTVPEIVSDGDNEEREEEDFDLNNLLNDEKDESEDESEDEEEKEESEQDIEDVLSNLNEEEPEEEEPEEEEPEEEEPEEEEPEEEEPEEEEPEEEEPEEEEPEEEEPEEEEPEEEDSEEEDSEDDEIELRTTKSSQLTPTRLKIKFPRSPTRSKSGKITDLSSKLKSLRYSIIKLIMNEDESMVSYAVCFDPNGEIVFIDLKDNKTKNFDEEKLIRVSYKDEKIDMSSSFIEGIRNKITFEIYGVVFYDGKDYSFIRRDDEGTLSCDNYTTVSGDTSQTEFLPFVYSVIDFNSLIKDPILAIKRTKLTYQIIQTEQVESNKFTISSLMDTSKELTNSLYNFERVYKNITKDIVDDWKRLSEYSSDYYDKFNNDDLDLEEKENFDKVTVNMFARFQLFNEQVEKVDSLTRGIEKIKSSIYTINTTIDELQKKSDNLKNKIIDIGDLELYI